MEYYHVHEFHINLIRDDKVIHVFVISLFLSWTQSLMHLSRRQDLGLCNNGGVSNGCGVVIRKDMELFCNFP